MRQALILLPVLSLVADRAARADSTVPEPANLPEPDLNVAAPPLQTALPEIQPAPETLAPEAEAPVLLARSAIASPSADSLLWAALERSDVNALETALRSGAKPNITRDGGQTPLMLAAQSGALELVGPLIVSGASLDTRDARGFTALMTASENRSTGVVEALLAAGADPNVANTKGETALERLCYAVRYLRESPGKEAANALQQERRAVILNLIRVLLDKGANPNIFSEPKNAPLVNAARFGELPLVEMLLHSGADANGRSAATVETTIAAQWETPLQALLSNGNRARAEKIFLSDGGMLTVNAREQLRRRAGEQDLAIVDRLIEAGATADEGLQRFALLDAASGPAVGGGRIEVVKRLVKNGSEVQVNDIARRLALSDAVRQAPARIATAPVEKSVNLRTVSASKAAKPAPATAQKVAPRLATGPTLKLDGKKVAVLTSAKLLPPVAKKGGQPVTRDSEKAFDAIHGAPQGWNPLIQAVRSGDAEVVQYLLSQGMDPNIRDAAGKTPLMHLCGAGRARWVRELPAERARALAKADENDVRIPTRVVSYTEKRQWREWAETGDVAILRALVKAGARINAADNDGRTPLMYAARRSTPGVVRELLKLGANVNQQDHVGNTALMQVIGGGRYVAAGSWVSPLLQAEAREARARALQVRSYANTVAAQTAINRYELQRELIRQEAERDDSMILCELRRAKTNLNLRDTSGRTALDLAVAAGQQHSVRWLVADVY